MFRCQHAREAAGIVDYLLNCDNHNAILGIKGGSYARKGSGINLTIIEDSEFKARCLCQVMESGEKLVTTKNGGPVSRLVPYPEETKLVYGHNRHNIRITGDVVSPMPAEWFDKPEESGEDLF